MSTSSWWRYNFSTEKTKQFDVNPTVSYEDEVVLDAEGNPIYRRLSNYRHYLKLTPLLESQAPATNNIDERVFIVTHQLLELLFKQMVFDLHVIVSAVKRIAKGSDEELRDACFDSTSDKWNDALVAARRVRYTSVGLVRHVVRLLDAQSSDDRAAISNEVAHNSSEQRLDKEEEFGVLFRLQEFKRFRDYLPPASGFQSAQVRLIERAFGKSNLLRMRLFDAYNYWWHYVGVRNRHELMRVDDPLILGFDTHLARPCRGTPEFAVSELDDVLLGVLVSLHKVLGLSDTPDAPESLIPPRSAQNLFDAMVTKAQEHGSLTDAEATALKQQFQQELADGCARENQRRSMYATAEGAFRALRNESCPPHFLRCLEAIMKSDEVLFGTRRVNFMEQHQRVVKNAGIPMDDTGTAGGGRRYLMISHQLSELFPALAVLQRERKKAPRGNLSADRRFD